MVSFLQTKIWNYFVTYEPLYLDSNFTEIYFEWSNKQWPRIGLDTALAQKPFSKPMMV